MTIEPSGPLPLRHWLRLVGLTSALLVAIAVVSYILLRYLVCLPTPTGPYPVGQTVMLLRDDHRIDPWTGKTPREILVYVFFPAERPGTAADYFPHLGYLAKNFEGIDAYLIRLVPYFISAAATEDTQAAADLGPLPAILFSPGAHTPVFLYRSLLEDLASHGYAVIAIEPTHEGVGQVFPDGRVMEPPSNAREPANNATPEDRKDFYNRRVIWRLADLSFVLDKLAADSANHSLPSHLNLRTDQFAVFGHSLGGVVAAESARRDPRVITAVNLDGLVASYPYLEDDPTDVKGTSLFFLGKQAKEPTDDMLRQMKITRARWITERDKRLTQRTIDLSQKYREIQWLELENTAHDDFSDAPFFYPHTHDVSTTRLARIRSELLRYFNQHFAKTSVSRP